MTEETNPTCGSCHFMKPDLCGLECWKMPKHRDVHLSHYCSQHTKYKGTSREVDVAKSVAMRNVLYLHRFPLCKFMDEIKACLSVEAVRKVDMKFTHAWVDRQRKERKKTQRRYPESKSETPTAIGEVMAMALIVLLPLAAIGFLILDAKGVFD